MACRAYITTPFRVEEDIWVSALKLGSQARPAGLAQLYYLVGRGLLARGPGPKPMTSTTMSYLNKIANKW